jgi:hypothetical protein
MFKKAPILFFCSGMILALVLELGSPTSFAEDGQVKLVGDMSQLPALVPYLANEILPVGDPNTQNTLVVGSDLNASGATPPFPLIFPEDAQIVGAMVSQQSGNRKPYTNYEIYLTSTLSPSEFIQFYMTNLGPSFSMANGKRRNGQPLYNPASGNIGYCYTDTTGLQTLLVVKTTSQADLTQATISISRLIRQQRNQSLC